MSNETDNQKIELARKWITEKVIPLINAEQLTAQTLRDSHTQFAVEKKGAVDNFLTTYYLAVREWQFFIEFPNVLKAMSDLLTNIWAAEIDFSPDTLAQLRKLKKEQDKERQSS